MKPSSQASAIPKVSVSITTYNHERWIAQAIESVLCQRTAFPFEILIGEDDSDDRTRQIVVDYANRYPTIIRPFLNDRRNVLYIGGFPTGRWNFINNLQNARGEYVAILEGDDYWCDRDKLEKQVEILDAHGEHAICFHDTLIEEPDGRLVSDYVTRRVDAVTTLSDLAEGNYIQTPSCMYRRKNLVDIPPWLWKTRIGDFPLHMQNARHGSIYKIDEAMAVYRNTGLGVHSSLTTMGKQEAWIQTLDILINEFDCEIGDILRRNLTTTAVSLLERYLVNGQPERTQALLTAVAKHASSSVAEALVEHSALKPAFERVCRHPIIGPLIALVRFLKRDPSFGRLFHGSSKD